MYTHTHTHTTHTRTYTHSCAQSACMPHMYTYEGHAAPDAHMPHANYQAPAFGNPAGMHVRATSCMYTCVLRCLSCVLSIQIKAILALPVLVVLDEAYIEFSEVPSRLNWVREYPNLVVLRTFSKSAGV